MFDRVRIARDVGVHPKRIHLVIGADARHVVEDPLKWIPKDDDELADLDEDSLLAPFADEILRDPAMMHAMIAKLLSAGFLGFRRRARAFVGRSSRRARATV